MISTNSKAIIPWQLSDFNMIQFEELKKNNFISNFTLYVLSPQNSLVSLCSRYLGKYPVDPHQINQLPNDLRASIRFYRWLNINRNALEGLLQKKLSKCLQDLIWRITSFIKLYSVKDFKISYRETLHRETLQRFLPPSPKQTTIHNKLYHQSVKIVGQFLLSKKWVASVEETEQSIFGRLEKVVQIEINGCGEIDDSHPYGTTHSITKVHQFYKIIGLEDDWDKRNQANPYLFALEVEGKLIEQSYILAAELKTYQQDNPLCWKEVYNILIEEGPFELTDYDPKAKPIELKAPAPNIISPYIFEVD